MIQDDVDKSALPPEILAALGSLPAFQSAVQIADHKHMKRWQARVVSGMGLEPDTDAAWDALNKVKESKGKPKPQSKLEKVKAKTRRKMASASRKRNR